MLKLWSFIYRTTGWYSPWARVAEYEAVRKWLETEEAFLTLAQLGMADGMGLFIGSWQADHGFTRRWRP
jgi:hypothetical protein